tara:strand:- start:9689 stop:9871 length:183 start_codon:yes stop_codon:yes gene_type:complete
MDAADAADLKFAALSLTDMEKEDAAWEDFADAQVRLGQLMFLMAKRIGELQRQLDDLKGN